MLSQALNAMLFPVAAAEEAAAAAAATTGLTPQDVFVSSGCICALLEAVKIANASTAGGETLF